MKQETQDQRPVTGGGLKDAGFSSAQQSEKRKGEIVSKKNS